MKPMLAAPAPEIDSIRFPVLASPKLDGVRCVLDGAKALSRTLKPIPNDFVQHCLSHPLLNGLDGELIVGDANAEDVYLKTNSGVMSKAGCPNFTFYVFDHWNGAATSTQFADRIDTLTSALKGDLYSTFDKVKVLGHKLIHNADELREYQTECLNYGFEGVMLRDPKGVYKYGRSTQKQGGLLKLKNFTDGEAIITGFVEQLRNDNEAYCNECGHTERSSHKDNMTPMGTLGALIVRDCITGIEFRIGTGFSAALRQELWDMRDSLIGLIVKYKHFEIGVKDAPRFPVFVGLRDPIDL